MLEVTRIFTLDILALALNHAIYRRSRFHLDTCSPSYRKCSQHNVLKHFTSALLAAC